jgi:hypothetical protein
VFTELLRKIEAHSLAKSAAKMHAELAAYSTLSDFEGEQLIERLIDEQAQRVLSMAKWVPQGFKPRLPTELLPTLEPVIDVMITHDPSSPDGLSTAASAMLALAKGALVAQIREDIKAVGLDERRIAELIGEAPDAAVVGQAILAPIAQSLGG